MPPFPYLLGLAKFFQKGFDRAEVVKLFNCLEVVGLQKVLFLYGAGGVKVKGFVLTGNQLPSQFAWCHTDMIEIYKFDNLYELSFVCNTIYSFFILVLVSITIGSYIIITKSISSKNYSLFSGNFLGNHIHISPLTIESYINCNSIDKSFCPLLGGLSKKARELVLG